MAIESQDRPVFPSLSTVAAKEYSNIKAQTWRQQGTRSKVALAQSKHEGYPPDKLLPRLRNKTELPFDR